jgi:aryl-alcohol dehydrogenase-like predicted oxidoreductase
VSNLVIGGASLNRLSLVKTSKFLEESRRLGITEIDSAPLYGVEEKIGEILSGSKEFLYNSKVGRPIKLPITRPKIEEQIEKTLLDLRIEQINVLFIQFL